MLKLIEQYVGRPVNINEFLIVDYGNGNGPQIVEWTITDKPQPTIAELLALQPEVDKKEVNEVIYAQIKDIQLNKLPRAFFEPSEKEEGTTWLDYYTNQITDLRSRLQE